MIYERGALLVFEKRAETEVIFCVCCPCLCVCRWNLNGGVVFTVYRDIESLLVRN